MRLRWLVAGGAALVLFAAGLSGAQRDMRLIDAVRKADAGALRTLLKRGVDPNTAEADGTTALHWAARRNDRESVALLIGSRADASRPNRYGVTPLLVAAEYGSAPVVELLLKAGASPNSALPEGETALMTAARAGKVDVIRLLAARGANVNAQESWHGQTALMWAAGEGHSAAIETLVELGADYKARSDGGFTPLLFAARDGRLAAVKALIRLGASPDDVLDPNARGASRAISGVGGSGGSGSAGQSSNRPYSAPGETTGMSALVLAVGSAHYELASYLLEQGANPNAAAHGWTALHQLQYTRRHQRSRGLPPPEQTGTLDSLGMAKALLARGANPNARQTRNVNDGQRNALNRIGATAYLLAAKNADPPMMRLLAENGADIRIPTQEKATPLAVAAGLGLFAVSDDIGTNEEAFAATKLAYELGDHDVNAADDRGWTGIHGAALRAADDIVKFLAERGANLDVKTKKEGWTPLRIADGVFHNGTFKRSEATAALIRRLLEERGLPVPPIPDYKKELEESETTFKR